MVSKELRIRPLSQGFNIKFIPLRSKCHRTEVYTRIGNLLNFLFYLIEPRP